MRGTIAAAAVLAAIASSAPANAEGIAIGSAVFRERAGHGGRQIEPATTLARGDRVVTILRWDAPRGRRYTVTSPVPARLVLESASDPGVEISSDGGRTWRVVGDPDSIPAGITHLRWQAGPEGRLSYRAVVR